MSKPVFVIGRHRSGTTFLTNSLLELADFYSPQNNSHKGQIESFYFSHIASLFEYIETPENIFAAKVIFESSDFFQQMKLDGNVNIIESNKQIDNYHSVFVNPMELLCTQLEKKYWVEKTPNNVIYIDKIKEIKEAHFIVVKRRHIDVTISVLTTFYEVFNYKNVIRETLLTAAYENILNEFIVSNNEIIVIDFNDMINNGKKVERLLSEFLGCDIILRKDNPNPSPNRAKMINKLQLFLLKIFYWIGRLIPSSMWKIFLKKLLKFKNTLPKMAFKNQMEKY